MQVRFHLNQITFNSAAKKKKKKRGAKVFELHEQYGKSYYTLVSSLEIVLHNFPFVFEIMNRQWAV